MDATQTALIRQLERRVEVVPRRLLSAAHPNTEVPAARVD